MSRKRDGLWRSELKFQDQVHIEKILIAAKPHVVDKKILVDIMLEAMKKHSTEREPEFKMIRAFIHRFNGRHKFEKLADGSYVDGKRSIKRPHITHKGKLLSPQPPPVQDVSDEGVEFE